MTHSVWVLARWYHISTHILTRRMTLSTFHSSSDNLHFNSHPHKEDDAMRIKYTKETISFQLTSSRGGWLKEARKAAGVTHFNSHPHEEDDAAGSRKRRNSIISTHILTRRMTIRHCKFATSFPFQLTSSRGGWRLWKEISHKQHHFNSHPHEEDDEMCAKKNCSDCISTHILTRRMTESATYLSSDWEISTHILTRRMTTTNKTYQYDSIFQLTSSRGGWPCSNACIKSLFAISTHILTRRMTISSLLLVPDYEFQLTSSQGGWHFLLLSFFALAHFNSHPHKEDDPSPSISQS